MKIYVLQNKRTKKIVAQFDYNYNPSKLKYTDSGLPPYIWSEEELNLHTEEDIAKEKWVDLSKFEFKLVDLAFQDKWQKLKGWLIQIIKIKGNSPKYYKLNDVLEKMQELEGEDE